MLPELKVIVEEIRIAVIIDRKLPPVFRNRYRCPLGAFHRPETDEIADEQQDDINENIHIYRTRENFEVWRKVVSDYMPRITDTTDQRIVWLRAGGAGWKKVSEILHKERRTFTEWERQTLYRHYILALKKIWGVKKC